MLVLQPAGGAEAQVKGPLTNDDDDVLMLQPGGSAEAQVNGKDDALPFNSYSQPSSQTAPAPTPSPRPSSSSPAPAPTPSPRIPSVDSDDPLDIAETRLVEGG